MVWNGHLGVLQAFAMGLGLLRCFWWTDYGASITQFKALDNHFDYWELRVIRLRRGCTGILDVLLLGAWGRSFVSFASRALSCLRILDLGPGSTEFGERALQVQETIRIPGYIDKCHGTLWWGTGLYWESDIRRGILRRQRNLLKPGGWWFQIGGSASTMYCLDLPQRIHLYSIELPFWILLSNQKLDCYNSLLAR